MAALPDPAPEPLGPGPGVPAGPAVPAGDFRRSMAHFVSGVTVLTAVGHGRPYAMTATAFASVSLAPPQVLVSVGHGSRFHPVVTRAGRFAVSVLAADQADLARRFSRSGRDLATQFDGVAHGPAPWSGSPVLAGVLAWLDCETVATHLAGDHTILIGAVRATSAGTATAAPLAYYQGDYVTLR